MLVNHVLHVIEKDCLNNASKQSTVLENDISVLGY